MSHTRLCRWHINDYSNKLQEKLATTSHWPSRKFLYFIVLNTLIALKFVNTYLALNCGTHMWKKYSDFVALFFLNILATNV